MAVNRLIQRLGGDDRVDLLRAVRESDVSPYFRVMESATAPIVQVEGADRIMLGSNNYLGLADHPAIRQGAQDALDTFGGAITGSRLLNGTMDLHLDLESEIAEWHGTEDAMVFTTGYQTNLAPSVPSSAWATSSPSTPPPTRRFETDVLCPVRRSASSVTTTSRPGEHSRRHRRRGRRGAGDRGRVVLDGGRSRPTRRGLRTL